MTEKLELTDIRQKMAKHYGGNNKNRELRVWRIEDDNFGGRKGSVIMSFRGSPPKGLAVYIPGNKLLNIYDCKGKRWRKQQATIEDLPSKFRAIGPQIELTETERARYPY